MRRRDYLTGLTTATLALAGCAGGAGGDGGDGGGSGGGQSDGGGDATTTATEQPSSTAPTTATTARAAAAREAYPDYSWSSLDGASPTATDSVTLRGSAFHPLVARVSTGTEVRWTNEDGYGHTVTIPALDVHRELGGGEQTTVTVDEAGTYDYLCRFHPPSMLGRLVVVEGTVTSGDGTSTEMAGGSGY
ncbi:MAG: cupredoxin domain-containing protein [Halobacteriaceae archaeon]